eukprot:scaffold27966_cov64-Phaeocystis_antarctica.AAC.9
MAAALNSSTTSTNCAASLCSSASVDSVLVVTRLSSACTSATSSDATSEAWEVESACSAASAAACRRASRFVPASATVSSGSLALPSLGDSSCS